MIKPWRRLGRQTLIDDRWMTLHADALQLPNGRVLDPWYVVERPSWAAIVALTPAGEVVLTREFRPGAGVVALGLPGGVLEAGETARAAAARELAEETGYACPRWREIGALHANWKMQTNQLHVVVGVEAVPRGVQALDEGEDIEVELMQWGRWMDLMTSPPAQAFYVAATFLADRWLSRGGGSEADG